MATPQNHASSKVHWVISRSSAYIKKVKKDRLLEEQKNAARVQVWVKKDSESVRNDSKIVVNLSSQARLNNLSS